MDTTVNERLRSILTLLPVRIAKAVAVRIGEAAVEEIRLRTARPPQIVTAKDEVLAECASFTADEAKELLEKLCRHSVYSMEEELRQGFITLEGGMRVGVCGRPVIRNGAILRLVDVYGFNIRFTAEATGCAEGVLKHISEHGYPLSSLIVSPPAGGKTTLLRDIARCISDGVGMLPQKVAIADERGELAGCIGGRPSFDIGARTDVFDMTPKAEAISMLVRTMSPNVIITDEIGSPRDTEAISEAARCGVCVIASAHAASRDDLFKRKSLRPLFDDGVFKRILLLKRSGSILRMIPITP